MVKAMTTEIKIPVTPAPQDPDWLLRKLAGKRLTSQEKELYYAWKHDLELERLKKRIDAPGMGSMLKVLEETNTWKTRCTTTQGCMGWNKDIYDGVSD